MTTPPFSGHHCSFVVACNEKGGELLAVELPGRESRRAEQRFLTLRDAAAALFPILAPTLNQPGVPYVMIGHSMGTWMLFETLKLLMSKGVALPAQVCCRPAFVRPSRHTTLRTALQCQLQGVLPSALHAPFGIGAHEESTSPRQPDARMSSLAVPTAPLGLSLPAGGRLVLPVACHSRCRPAVAAQQGDERQCLQG
eukprot:scaffold57437_cov33-Tisochrysis_lutea.AAC.3